MAETAFTPAQLNEGFVVAIEIVAKAGKEDTIAGALQALVTPTMAEPGVKLFLPFRSPTNPASFFIFELYKNEAGWRRIRRPTTSRRSSKRCCRISPSASVSPMCRTGLAHRAPHAIAGSGFSFCLFGNGLNVMAITNAPSPMPNEPR